MFCARPSPVGAFGAALVLFLSTDARAAYIQLAPVADTRIIESIYSPSSINTNYSSDFLALYHGRGNEQRTLLGFNLAGRPQGSILQSAILTLTASTHWGDNSAHVPMEVYRVTQSWTENAVSWNYRDGTNVWSRAGATYAGLPGISYLAPYASNSSNAGEGGEISFNITNLVEEWTNGIKPNYGLIIISGLGNGLTFDSKEQSAASRTPIAPSLTINYSFLDGHLSTTGAFSSLTSRLELSVPESSTFLFASLGSGLLLVVGRGRGASMWRKANRPN